MVNIEGVLFRNSIVIASCPLTESVYNIKKCIEKGAGGIILKTAADYSRDETADRRKILFAKNGYWAQSTFEREIMTMEEAENICKEVTGYDMVPIIASVSAQGLNPTEWITISKRVETLGAAMIQLDFFYLNNMWADNEFASKLVALLVALKEKCTIPIVPKININLPADFIFPLLKHAGINTVSLLDSVRVPVVSEWIEGDESHNMTNEGTSFFGAWQLPLTLSYLVAAKNYGLNVIGGGGVTDKKDVDIMLRHGADAVQIASAAMFGRYDVISQMVCEAAHPATYQRE